MTRLKHSDIRDISSRFEAYNQDLHRKTGRTLLGIACHACGMDEINIARPAGSFCIHVIPVTAEQGIIPDFSETVCAILQYLGFNAHVSDQADISGIAMAFKKRADAIMMADDNKFVGINLNTRFVAENSEMTGRVYASVLDLMAKGIGGKDALVMGCGPVGKSAARSLLSLNARLSLVDKNICTALTLKKTLLGFDEKSKIKIEKKENIDFSNHQFILEATPSENTIPDSRISDHMVVAAPGVPLGISAKSSRIMSGRLVHDKLELGVAAMAVSLLK